MRNTTALVLAGGINTGFSVLTHNRAKSALPVCGQLRVIDFVMTNLSVAGVNHVGVIIQYLPGSLIDHIGIGTAWDFDAMSRRIKIMPPFVGIGKTEWFRGSADAVYQNLDFIRDTGGDLVLILPADNIYEMNYGALIAKHRRRNADLTIVTTKRPPGAPAGHFGYPTFDATGAVSEFVEKPETPPHDTVSTGIYLFNTRTLFRLLEDLAEEHREYSIPKCCVEPLAPKGRVFIHALRKEWDYLPDIEAYVRLHQRVLAGGSQIARACRNAMTNMLDRDLGSRPSPYFGRLSKIEESLVSAGCAVEGTVIRSVLSPGVRVAPKAVVRDSILFHDCEVCEGARLSGVVSDKDALYHPYCQVGDEEFSAGEPPTADRLVVVGKGAQVLQGMSVSAGWEIPINQVVSRDWVRERLASVS